MRIFPFFCFASIILLSSCSKRLSYFTESLHEEYNWSEEELKQVQFYVSEDIILQRQLQAEDSRITDGKIKIIGGREVEEIIFEKGTPGILLFSPKSNRFAVSFEEDKYLMFGPNQKASGRYVLLAKDWERRSGIITYNGQEYTTPSRSAYAALQVDLDNLRSTIYKVTKPKGRKVS